MAENRYLAGLDVGSTGCKIIVYDTDGNTLGRVYRDCPITRAMGAHEADAQGIADTVMAVIREAAENYPGIAGIGVASFGESFVLLDENDKPLLPVMLYTDPRGEEESAQLSSLLGE
ncbi:MAG: carbohydrate kinase, partial [Clostridia bacterium]|nr:carbohydrate kinase [Clostridia bacterium]